jgi:Fe2+ or Zn2+ uptake regulation protein
MKSNQLGCKRCGAVITVEPKVWNNRLDIHTKEAGIKEHSGNIEILCKKCHNVVAIVTINPK